MTEIIKANGTDIVMPNLIKGFDIGNAYVNFDDMSFASRVETGKVLKIGANKDKVHQIYYNGVPYKVGTGNTVMGDDKYKTEAFKILLLTAIALKSGKRTKNIRAKICVGLPILNYERMKEEVAEIIKGWGVQEITVNDTVYNIDIIHVDVFMEGAVVVKDEDLSHNISIDIGGGTVNVVEWDEMSPIKYDTFDVSIVNLYSRISTYLKEEYGASKTTEAVEEMLIKEETEIIVKGNTIDVSEIYKMVDEFVSALVGKMEEMKFGVNIVEKITVYGGGAYIVGDKIQEIFPHAIVLEDAQRVNSEVFDLVANM